MVEIYFLRRIGRECPATEVVNSAFGHDTNPITGQLHPPAKIDFLHVGKETSIETTQLPENIGPTTERRAADPKNIAGIVILTVIRFHAP